VSAPRNHFALDPAAASYCFIAGGIGITPIVSMIRWCVANGRRWRLVYASRSAQRAAFYEVLREHGDAVRFHFDDQHGLLDLGAVLASLEPEEHVYCCGPQPMMAAVEAQASPLQAARVHFEYFAAPADSGSDAAPAGAFRVELRRSGMTLDVAPDQSILEAVEAAGLAVPFSCREGTCRTCETSICSGTVEHRDYVLSQDERAAGKSMMICVSRATSELLVLDL
jgi:ferredoxin-NADP reductase